MKKNHQAVDKYEIKVKIVRAKPGGVFEEGAEFNCGSVEDAKRSADRMQNEFDDDGDPCRTYVYRGSDPLPIYAGRARFFYDKKKDTNRKGVSRFN